MTKPDHAHNYNDNWTCTICGYVLSSKLWDLKSHIKPKPQIRDELRRRLAEDKV
ncbi:MAG: hypothetical protein ACLPY5_13370 [Candidatus Bathyarchaeia archaeon]